MTLVPAPLRLVTRYVAQGRDEEAVEAWIQLEKHRAAQAFGREKAFKDYRLRVASVIRDYGMLEREQAPSDSRRLHG